MSFFVFLAAGFFSGILGGMGMGGGTLLIPVLTVFFKVEQHVAQATNLIAFLPMAVFSLYVHKKDGNLSSGGEWLLVVPAVVASVLGGVAAAFMPAYALKKLFGAFLIILGVKGLLSSITARGK